MVNHASHLVVAALMREHERQAREARRARDAGRQRPARRRARLRAAFAFMRGLFRHTPGDRERGLAAAVRDRAAGGPLARLGASPGGRALAGDPELAETVARRLERGANEPRLAAEVERLLTAGGDAEDRLRRIRWLVA